MAFPPKQPLTREALRLLSLRRKIQKVHLRRLREEDAVMRKGVFAERLGLGDGQVRKLESGTTLLTAQHRARYGAALGMGIVTLDTKELLIAAEIEGTTIRLSRGSGYLAEAAGPSYDAGRPRPDSARWTDYWAQAGADSRACGILAAAGSCGWACFVAYAAAVDAAKAVVVERGGDPSSSSIQGLLESIIVLPLPAQVGDAAAALDNHSEISRDPAAHESGHPEALYSAADARDATERLQTIVEFCRQQLPGKPPLP